jgi:hypothetical protein
MVEPLAVEITIEVKEGGGVEGEAAECSVLLVGGRRGAREAGTSWGRERGRGLVRTTEQFRRSTESRGAELCRELRVPSLLPSLLPFSSLSSSSFSFLLPILLSTSSSLPSCLLSLLPLSLLPSLFSPSLPSFPRTSEVRKTNRVWFLSTQKKVSWGKINFREAALIFMDNFPRHVFGPWRVNAVGFWSQKGRGERWRREMRRRREGEGKIEGEGRKEKGEGRREIGEGKAEGEGRREERGTNHINRAQKSPEQRLRGSGV